MIQRHHRVDSLCAEFPHALRRFFENILLNIEAAGVGDDRLEVRRYEAEYPNAHAALFDDHYLGIIAVNLWLAKEDIRGEDGKFKLRSQFRERPDTAVEVVVAEYPCVESQRRQRAILGVAVLQAALLAEHNIAALKEKYGGLGGHFESRSFIVHEPQRT